MVCKVNSDVSIQIEGEIISNSTEEKLLGITFDSTLSFDKHVSKLCKQANKKIHALARVSKYMSQSKRKLIMNAFIKSQFGYCPLVWMFHSRGLNNRINKIHERALRLVYNDSQSTFADLLTKDNSVSIHDRNLQILATEIYKLKLNESPRIIESIFKEKNIGYETRKSNPFITNNVKTVKYGTETLSFRGPKTWSMVPEDIKKSKSLADFKRKIKSWIPVGCECRLCKIYIPNLGFL